MGGDTPVGLPVGASEFGGIAVGDASAAPRSPSTLRVLVTGASGFIGAHLVEHLSVTPREVRILSRAAFAGLRSGSEVTTAGVFFQDCQAVVHLAARAHVLDETNAAALGLYRDINRDATLALARAAAAAGVRRFIFLSSIRVNGGTTQRLFQPSDIPAPEEPYAISKHEAEQGLWQIAADTDLEVVVVRPPLVYGPGVKGNFLRLLKLAASGLPLPLGSVSGVRSLVSVWNLCDLIARCLDHPAAVGQTFLAGDDEDITLPNLVRTLADGMGRPCRVFRSPPALVRAGAVGLGKGATFDKLTAPLQVDISETKRLLDWKPPMSLPEGLVRTARWYAQTVLVKGTSRTA